MALQRILGFIDESGVNAISATAGPCFILAAAMFDEERSQEARTFLAKLRKETGRGERAVLHWNQIEGHADRKHVAAALGASEFLTVSSVVVCKHRLAPAPAMDHGMRYLYAFRFLLERMTWFARDRGRKVHYTLAHVKGFKKERLREYKNKLFGSDEPNEIAWANLDGLGVIDQPQKNEFLQLADLCASSTGAAFNPDKHGRVETSYLLQALPRFYRRGNAALTSYGLKIHPRSGLEDHSWVRDLK